MSWVIYFMGVADDVKLFSILAALFTGFLSVIALSMWLEHEDDAYKKTGKRIASSCIVFVMLGIFLPSSQTIAAIYVIPKIVENKQLSELPNKALEVSNLKLDEWTKNLKVDNNEEK